MERVQFQQEQMLDELKDLVEKKVFTVAETKQIMKQRSTFEATLVRRIAKKSDFLRYASYEMGLEHLRRKRVERLTTISDFALVRRQFHIFERALKRFKSDVGLWIEYIQVAKNEGARSLVGRITARALQLHPNVPALYILAASHELAHLSPSTARTLLQRGIRLNADNVEMWTEYVKMELGFIESLRRRWDLLGISKVETESDMDPEIVKLDQEEAARTHVLDGIIVKAVLDSAVKALPQIELFESLNQLLTTYPSPPFLRQSLVIHLDLLLRSTLPRHPRAIKILYTRLLTSTCDTVSPAPSSNAVPQGQALIQGIQRANEFLISILSESQEEPLCQVYAQFVLDWCLPGTLTPAQVELAIFVVCSHQADDRGSAQRSCSTCQSLDTARRYTSRAKDCAAVWLARLDALDALGETVEMEKVWHEARQSVFPNDVKVWMWGLSKPFNQDKRLNVYENLLNESIGDPALYEELLLGYVTTFGSKPEALRRFLCTGKVWQKTFQMQVETGGKEQVLREIYESWRKQDMIEATITWAEWLLNNGKGKEASELIVRSKGSVGEKEMEARWVRVLGLDNGSN
ncbi:U3 small nucleolar RNA-associated protein 6-domain-containing protein [Rhodocollybia butyracea]|uniref:U3 small nucleolar RNA-associated protein 6-domain-containing protein n=1 Tax=Rhodocollybia butyracea TaxID=206335 RepID=A0A9P5TZT3_9AGAR|nr:U3 small nucleolar RNA-associated protein 6-domain-containing protein [Rhodocollybia butyracea]